jgi:hypothetical protein
VSAGSWCLTSTACLSVSVFAPTEVPKALATSLEPVPGRRQVRQASVVGGGTRPLGHNFGGAGGKKE